MLVINGLYFVRTKRELTESLFKPVNGRTASGLYKVVKGGVHIFNERGELFACIVNNHHGERFFVSASKANNGRAFYSFGLNTLDAQRLGLGGLSYSQEREVAVKAIESLEALH